ncbi:MAG TPA: hybrid sensor histidine kinase/response regulator [Herpetosiphonaceae bacterium]|nr:hybrid sensor histidine kinase/response regulator [Herpetosiphonaceae bacterium]
MTTTTRTVLIIDDTREDRETYRRFLARDERYQYVFYESATAEEGLEDCRRCQPDIVLVDYLLPDDDGLSVVAALAEEHGQATFCIVMLTGAGDEGIAVRAMQLGAHDYLVKTAQMGQRLLLAIDHGLDKVRLQQEIKRQRGDLEQSNEQLRAALAAYQKAAARARFMSDASAALTASLDSRETLTSLARLASVHFGAVCCIDVVTEHRTIELAAVAHSDPAIEAGFRAMRQAYPVRIQSAHPVAHVLRSGAIVVLPEIPAEVIASNTYDDAHRRIFNGLGLASALLVPLAVRGQPIGVIALYAVAAPARYDQDDINLLQELAQRAALALDNAQLYREAQDAIKERDAFILVASHELKNPLAGLIGRAQLLQRRVGRLAGGEKAGEDAAIISTLGQRIDGMLTELLDVSRISASQFAIVREPLDLGALVERVRGELQETTAIHTISLRCQAPSLTIQGDAARLEQVFYNLLNNAIKYAPDGGMIDIDIDDHGESLWISIRDEGIGIPAIDLPNVFKRFYRAGAANGPRIGGTGVGLYVVKEIVHAHGGVITVASTEGAGSTFTVVLPLPERAAG